MPLPAAPSEGLPGVLRSSNVDSSVVASSERSCMQHVLLKPGGAELWGSTG